MTTGTTGQLGLALPVQGELSGTWGDTVNNGITQYTNLAIAATLTLTNDGAVTLANTTGDASATNITSSLTGAGTVTAQHAIVRVTGTLTTTKVITGPSYSKTYVVINDATGGSVTIKASGQTGVTIAVGDKALVAYNGTDYVRVGASAGGSNTQVQYNSGGNLAGSANLTFNGTTLSSGGLITTTTGSPTDGTGQVFLNGATSNRVEWAATGTGAPAFTTRSAGTKALFYPALSGSQVDYAMGVDSATLWSSVPVASSSFFFKWYGGQTQVASLDGTGAFTANTLTPTNALGVAYGGTGATTLAAANIPVTNVANTFSATQTFNGSSSTFGTSLLDSNETVNVVGSAPSSTTNFYIQSGSVQYYTSNAANNWTLNIAFSSGTSLNTALTTGQSVTFTLVTTQGSTAYYATAIQVDGTTSGVTTRWIGGAPTAGNASGLDVYRFAVIKTASATYTVLASLTQYKA